MNRRTDDLRIREIRPLIPPAILAEELPITDRSASTVAETRAAVAAVLRGEDPRLRRGRRAVLHSRSVGGARVRGTHPRRRPPSRRRSHCRDAGVLREAAHGGGLEGPHQRSRPRRELPHQQGAAARADAAPGDQRARPAYGFGVPRHAGAAVPRRPDVGRGDRRAHDREPGAPRTCVGPLHAGGVQERHQWQRADRRGRRGVGAAAALVRGGHQAGHRRHSADRRQRYLLRRSCGAGRARDRTTICALWRTRAPGWRRRAFPSA